MCHQSNSATCQSPTPKLLQLEVILRHFYAPRHLHFKQHQRRFRSIEALLELGLKPPGTSKTSTSNTKNIQNRIIQIIFLNLKVHWNYAQKPLKTSRNHKSVKLYGFNPPKPQKISPTNLQR